MTMEEFSAIQKIMDVMDVIHQMNPRVEFGTFHAGKDSLEWCGSVKGPSLKLPFNWKYSKAKRRIVGPQFNFYYGKDRRYVN